MAVRAFRAAPDVYISDEVRICHKYSGEAVYLFRVGPRPEHMLSETPTAPSSPPGIFLSFFLGLDEAVNPVLGSPEIHRYHRVCLRTLSDEFSTVSSCLTPDLDAVCFFLHDVQPPSTEPILKSRRVSSSERSDQN